MVEDESAVALRNRTAIMLDTSRPGRTKEANSREPRADEKWSVMISDFPDGFVNCLHQDQCKMAAL